MQAAVEAALDKARRQDERGLSEGLLITALRHQLDMADAVQAAVAKAVEAERAGCAKRIDNEVKVARMRGPQHVPVLTALAAAIRSRGVAG